MIGVLLEKKRSNVTPLDFFGTYDSRELCDRIAHLDYYFDLYELFDARRV